ncbi:MAG: ATP-dependent helicase [Xanthomonadales bacterium]|nr:ATP-dependent helicase [Xanthomonadales bacterium]
MTSRFCAARRRPNKKRFSTQQINQPGPARLKAGPGAGKTSTLTELVTRLLENGQAPERVLLTTYGARAALDLRDKVSYLTGRLAPASVWTQNVVTTHALASRLLIEFYHWTRKIPTYATDKTSEMILTRDLIKTIWKREEDQPAVKEVLYWIGQAKSAGIEFSQLDYWFTERLGMTYGPALASITRQLSETMTKRGFWSFDDQLYWCEQKLKTDPVFLKWAQNRYDIILVDEAQDMSRQRLTICLLLAQVHQRIALVGDHDQLLMRFSGATPEIFMEEFDRALARPPVTQFLTRNHRSAKVIVAASNALIQHNYQRKQGPYPNQLNQDMIALDDAPGQIQLFSAESVYAEAAEVARLIKTRAEELSAGDPDALGEQYGSMFVLTRTRAYQAYFEGALRRLGVPFISTSGGSFWSNGFVHKLLVYLRLADDGSQFDLVGQVINLASDKYHSSARKLGKDFVDKLRATQKPTVIEGLDVMLFAPTSPAYWRAAILDFKQLLQAIKSLLDQNALLAAATYVVDHCLAPFILSEEGDLGDDGNGSLLDDLQSALDFIPTDLVASYGAFPTLKQLLKETKSNAAEQSKDWTDKVAIATIHSVKGGERRDVYAVGWAESDKYSLFPHQFSLVEPPQRGKLAGRGMGRLEDERCLAFVAGSRPRQLLCISWPRFFMDNDMRPSRFITEMGLNPAKAREV